MENVNQGLVEFENCTFHNNESGDRGGSLYCVSSMITFVDSVVSACDAFYGGGLYVTNPSEKLVDLSGSTISGNYAVYGGGLACERGICIGGNVINNTAYFGGGVWLEDADPTLNGMLVRENHAIGNGGGVYTPGDDAYPDVITTTVCGNTPNQVWHIEGDATNIINESCSSNPAACCVNGACIMVEPLMCGDVGGTLSNGGEEDCNATQCAEPCLGDVNNDSEINVNDLLTVIANWGGCP